MNKKLKFSITLITLLLISCAGDVSSQTSFESSSSNTYTVAFDSRGGSIVPNQIVEPNSFISPPNVSKEGHNLEGWYTSLNDGVTLENRWNFFEDKANFDFTLYASWFINQYTISFESNGGNTINSITDDYGANLTTPSPTKIGHSFSGWYTDFGLTQSFILTTMPASNLTLYANWSINQYTITFETNGGSSIASITGDYGDPVTSTNNPTREGYTFNGWYADANLTQTATVPNAIPAQNLTFYAGWTINQYTLTFESNGGSIVPSITSNYGDNLNILTPTKEVHSFGGWFTDLGLTQAFTLTTMPASNLTLYAKWTINQYTITFETNGGTSIASITGNYGDAVSVPSNPTREDNTFNGWYADANLTQTATVPNTIPAQNLTFYAGWTTDGIQQISLGENHSSALSSHGRVFMWGYNGNGQLGNGSTTNIVTPTEITSAFSLTAGDKIISLSLGFYHSSALSSNGRVFMWGNNGHGNLGDDTFTARSTPTEITSAFSLTSGDKIISLSLGSNHSSALSSHGRVFMWGYNYDGQSGDGTTTIRNVPTEITSRFSLATGDKIILLSLGEGHSSALSSHGRVFMWGYNDNGQLGNGSTTNIVTPTEITASISLTASDKIISLSLGSNHSSALSSHGRVFMWGSGFQGKLASGWNISFTFPIEISVIYYD